MTMIKLELERLIDLSKLGKDLDLITGIEKFLADFKIG